MIKSHFIGIKVFR